MYSATTATKKIVALDSRIRAVTGGTSASKTVSIVLYLIHRAQSDKKPTLTSIVSESFPHLKRGVMRDFLLIMQEHNYFDDKRWNKTDYTYTFETGSKIEFFSADQPGKVRGPRRDRLFINEANNVPYESFDQLEVRTKEFIFIDWNPISEFWFYTDVLDKRDDVQFITLTYKDNEALDPQIVAAIEQRRSNKNWWRIFGEGKLGEAEGRIYTGWATIDEVPHEARLVRRGLDFGYTNDPSAIVDVYEYNGGYILDEVLFAKGQNNGQLADTILNQPQQVLVIGDSSEPKSIDEIREYGVNIIGATKSGGEGKSETYLKWSIGVVQDCRISVTKRSLNILKEYRNYLWITDKDGKITNTPEGGFDHAMDAIRYAIVSLKGIKKPDEEERLRVQQRRRNIATLTPR